MSQRIAEILLRIELLQEISIAMQKHSIMFVDSPVAIVQVEGEDSSGQTRFINVRYKFVMVLVRKKVVRIQYCESRIMLADIIDKEF